MEMNAFWDIFIVPFAENPWRPKWLEELDICSRVLCWRRGNTGCIENEVEQGSVLNVQSGKSRRFTEASIKTFLWNTNLSKPTF